MLYVLLAMAGIAGIYIWARFIEPNWIEVRREEIPVRDLPDTFEGFRIAVISDLHYPRSATLRLIRRAIRLSNLARPDIVLFAGDFCARGKGEAKVVPPLGPVLADIQHRFGVFGVLGNRDHSLDANGIREELKNASPVQLIENRFVLLGTENQRLAIAGVGDLWANEVDLTEALSAIPAAIPRILLAHNPHVAEMAAGFRIDLQVSGHTHGGQVNIPFVRTVRLHSAFGNKYRAGLVQSPTHLVYVNRGICSVRNLRFGCRPEVSVLVLRRERNP